MHEHLGHDVEKVRRKVAALLYSSEDCEPIAA